MWLPTASVEAYPNSRSAAGFQALTTSSRSMTTIATGLASTRASKYVFWRRTSAAASFSSVMSSMNPCTCDGAPSSVLMSRPSSRIQTVPPSAAMSR